MSKNHIFLCIFVIIFKVVLTACDEGLVHQCTDYNELSEINQISKLLRNISYSITNLSFNCNRSITLRIDSDLFPLSSRLKSLTFKGFNLEILPNTFKNLINLKFLIFKNCQFLHLHIAAFGGLRQLDLLDMSSNNVMIFNALLIPRSSYIQYLNLSWNNIEYFSESSYNLLEYSVNIIDIRNNNIACHCVNRWIYINKSLHDRLKLDRRQCPPLNVCTERLSLQSSVVVTVYSFGNVTVHCPINVLSTLNVTTNWISPHNEVFSSNDLRKHIRMVIQPLFLATTLFVNGNNQSLTIEYFRGYFAGTWTCVVMTESGKSLNNTVVLEARVRLKEIFEFSLFVGFTFAGCWLLLAIVVGLVQYCRETSCCRHRIDYNKSSLFDRRYAKTVIPVPMDDSVSDELASNDSEDASQPLSRTRHESCNNNDVQLIFTDENLADQYAQMLSELKTASEIGDENFNKRLKEMRTHFSADFSRMRFDIKRGMETLRSNSSAAAHKLRKGVVHMRDHMKSLTEFCGTASIAQSISIVVIPSDNSGQPNHEVGTVDRPHKRTVFNFFGPC